MTPDQTARAKAAALLRHRALAAATNSDPVARIEHTDRWRPATALALAQALDTTLPDPPRVDDHLQDLTAFATTYLGRHP